MSGGGERRERENGYDDDEHEEWIRRTRGTLKSERKFRRGSDKGEREKGEKREKKVKKRGS